MVEKAKEVKKAEVEKPQEIKASEPYMFAKK